MHRIPSMTTGPDRWSAVERVYHEALARPPERRAAFVAEACAGDEERQREVEALLAQTTSKDAFLEDGGVMAAAQLVSRMDRLLAGSPFGVYHVLSQIGVGGMGEVYRARDTRLGRDVAIKILPHAFAVDPDRLARFEREARVLASLNHQNIATIYGVEDAHGIRALVMELVEGPTLAERLADGLLSVAEALVVARQIAEALDVAHEKGIVHRDLKPANIKITPDGIVKVLDFGLAKVVTHGGDDAESLSPTITIGGTREGLIVGTAAYMSPEQTRGQTVDKRTDIWAFGCVLYEMLTGRAAFARATMTETLAAILERQPDWNALPDVVPSRVRRVIGLCLDKDVKERLRDIGDARRELADDLDSSVSRDGSHPASAWPRRAAIWTLAAASLLALLGAFVLGRSIEQGEDPALLHTALPIRDGVVPQPLNGFALSPDGTRLVFVAQDSRGVRGLWIRSLANPQLMPLAGAEGGILPFWSPDGRSIGFFAGQALKRVSAEGGTAQSLAAPTLEPKGGTWSGDGRIVYVPNYRSPLFEVAASGGPSRALTTVDAGAGELSHRWPHFLPDGKTLIFLVQTAEAGDPADRSRIEALDRNGIRHEVLKVNSSAAYTPPGRLLFWRQGSLYAQGLDARLRLQGMAKLVANDVELNTSELAAFTVSKEDALVYAESPIRSWRLEWRDLSGRPLSTVATPESSYNEFALAPDGLRVAYVKNRTAVWIVDLVRGTDSRLTFENVDHMSPAWSYQGDWLAYAANKTTGAGSEIVRRHSSGLGERQVLYSSGFVVRSLSWSPDGRSIAFEEEGNIFVLDVETRKVAPRVTSPGADRRPKFSSDGRWLAYVSNETGRDEVYVVPAGDGTAKWAISSRGGSLAEWGAAGDELFYLGLDGAINVVPITFGADLQPGLPKTLFSLSGPNASQDYQVGTGGRFLVRTPVTNSASQDFRLILNWPRLLE